MSVEYHCKITEYDNSLDSLCDYEKKNFHLSDICDFIKVGVQAIVDDEVTKRFDTEGKLFTNFYDLIIKVNFDYI